MTKNGFKDTRLLEALDYIDQDLIGKVAVKLKFEESAVLTEEPVMTWRTPFKHWKRMLATVACLLLLSAAFPVLNYAVQRFGTGIWEGFAGNNPYSDYDPNKDSAVFDYPVDMPAEEIYADLLNGDWVVYENEKMVTEDETWWDTFYQKVRDKEPALLRQAWYITTDYSSDRLPSGIEPDGNACLELQEVVYDGKKFFYSFRYIHPTLSFESADVKEYQYLKLSKNMYQNEKRYYFLTNDPKLEYWSPFSSLPAPDMQKIYYVD